MNAPLFSKHWYARIICSAIISVKKATTTTKDSTIIDDQCLIEAVPYYCFSITAISMNLLFNKSRPFSEENWLMRYNKSARSGVLYWVNTTIIILLVYITSIGHYAMQPLVSLQNGLWKMCEEIPYWWHIIIPYWLAEANFPSGTTDQKHYPDLGSHTSSVWKLLAHFSKVISSTVRPVVASQNIGCFLRLWMCIQENKTTCCLLCPKCTCKKLSSWNIQRPSSAIVGLNISLIL